LYRTVMPAVRALPSAGPYWLITATANAMDA
jgi:hypothetical protein